MPGLMTVLLLAVLPCRPPLRSPCAGEGTSNAFEADCLRTWMEAWMEEYHVPGLSACAIIGDSIIWEAHLGLRSICPARPVTDSTMFQLASVSKTFTGSAVIQLAEEGALSLDEDVGDFLPFAPENPNHPGQPISVRSLLIHTSSVKDNWDVMYESYCWGWDSPLTLAEYMPEYFLPGGEYYDAEKNFWKHQPSGEWAYSNMAYALLGYVVECAADTSFSHRTRTAIFQPLGMSHTAWFLANLDTSQVAVPCHWNPEEGYWEEYGLFGYPDYPAGQLRSSARDLSRMLMAMLAGGTASGNRILSQATVEEMLTPQCPGLNPNMGLTWFRSVREGMEVWGHGGGDYGMRTYYGFSPESNVAAVVLTNGEIHTGAVFNRLLRHADSIRTSPGWNSSELKSTLSLRASPNPASGSLNLLVVLPEPGPVTLRLYDSAGRIALVVEAGIRPRGPTSIIVPLDGLPQGVYQAAASTADALASVPVVVLR